MAKEYKVNGTVRFSGRIIVMLLRWGMPVANLSVLTVRGRKSGQTYSLPVELVEEGAKRWIVSPYGEVNWVKNVRAAGEASLMRGGKQETVRLIELPPQESAPVLKRYITHLAVTRPYFDVAFDAPLEAFVSEAPRHPVFLVS